MAPDIKIYALSTCVHCKHAKEYFEENHLAYDCIHVDLLTGDERAKTMDVVRTLNPSLSFPTIVIGKTVVVGFRRDEIENAIEACTK